MNEIREYLRMALNGDINAMFEIAKYYETNDRFDDDVNDSIDWYKKAAINGHLEAQLYLGKYYCDSRRDTDIAKEWYRKAAMQGDKYALEMLGKLLFKESNDVSYINSEHYLNCIDYDRSQIYIAAILGNPDAQFEIGRCYEWGDYEFEEDFSKSLFWYKKSGENGNIDGWIAAANIYMDSRSYFEYIDEYYFEEAEIEGMYNVEECFLGILLSDTENYKGDLEREKKNMRKYIIRVAAKYEYDEMIIRYGKKYNEQDVKKMAKERHERSIQRKNEYVDKELTKYENIIDEKGYVSYTELEELSNQGFPKAQYLLAKINEERGNYDEAFFWYRRASEHAESKALGRLAFFYENGLGVEKDIEKSEYCYKIAKKLDNNNSYANI